jgi:hypothetical protein
MCKKFLSSTAIAIALVLVGWSHDANAVTFNFQNQGEGNWDTIHPGAGNVFTQSGISVTADATGNAFSRAYLDGPLGGLPAGLGVCSFSGSCAGTTDDNVGFVQDNTSLAAEHLVLTFTTGPVQLTNLTFRDRDHGLFDGSLVINGTTFSVVGGTMVGSVSGSVFDFTKAGSTWPDRDFYVGAVNATAVPGPIVGAGLPGLIMACGGLFALAGRRRKTSTI